MDAAQRRDRDGSRTKPRVSKAERRRQLLTHARHLFTTRGYAATTPEEIAQAAGVSETMVKRHFPTQLDLFVGILDDLRDSFLRRWLAEERPTGDPLALLHVYLELWNQSSHDDGLLLHGLTRMLLETTEEEVRAGLSRLLFEAEGLLAQVIGEGQQVGVFRRSLDPRVGAWELLRSLLGSIVAQPLAPPLFQESDYPARAAECLLHSLLKTDV
jgi:AcrR family transcriptional regulator